MARHGSLTLTAVWAGLTLSFAWLSLGIALAEPVPDEEKARALVAMVEARQGEAFNFGAAVIAAITEDRLYLVTANHVVTLSGEAATDVRVRFDGDRDQAVAASVVQRDPERDIAVLVIPATGAALDRSRLKFDRTRSSRALRAIDGLNGLHPLGNPNQVGWFWPRAPDRFHELKQDSIVFESPSLMVGFSGGGLFTEDWFLVGMLQADDPPFGRALTIEALIERLKGWDIAVDLTVIPIPPAPEPPFKDCVVCPEMLKLPAGQFLMGAEDPDWVVEFNEEPRHRVEIPSPFAVSRYEITLSQFEAFVNSGHRMGSGCKVWHGDWKWDRDKNWRDPGNLQKPDSPVVCVSWDDAKAYADWLSQQSGKHYRLLTEAEWEYAARSSTTTLYWWGNRLAPGFANCLDCGSPWDGQQSARVGRFLPNWFGLYDMQGNVWEWVEDCWHDSYDGAPTDGSAWTEGGECHRRVMRGGAWTDPKTHSRAANRGRDDADNRTSSLGIRVARDLDPGER